MRIFRATLALVLLPLLGGCGYIHFGRLPASTAAMGDSALATAYSNLGTEHKMLQQELLLAQKERNALRDALDNRSTDGAAASSDLATRLNETTRELATLRASYAKLSEAQPAGTPAAAADPAAQQKLSDLENQLATSLHNYTQLQEENTRLRGEVEATRTENTALTAQVKTATAQNEQAQAALAQLNTELLRQKEARVRAEQQTAAAHAQLTAVLAHAGPATNAPGSPAASSLDDARESAAGSAATLRLAKAPPSGATATAELHTSPGRLRTDGPPDAVPGPAPRIHVVQAGDTLESIAKKYYGRPDRWQLLYSANNALLSGGRPLKPGMELEIPPAN